MATETKKSSEFILKILFVFLRLKKYMCLLTYIYFCPNKISNKYNRKQVYFMPTVFWYFL